MSTPRLTEVFVVREASVQSLAQRLRLPVDLCDRVNHRYRSTADALLTAFAWSLTQTSRPHLGKDADKDWEEFEDFMTSGGNELEMLLRRFPARKQQVLAAISSSPPTSDEVDNWQRVGAVALDVKSEAQPLPDLSGRALLTLPDGTYWVELTGEECDDEAQAMQHCGRPSVASSRMFSLRDRNGRPHVTAEIDVDGKYGTRLIQCKGKQNDGPDKKYWPAILGLCKELKVDPTKTKGTYVQGEDEAALFAWVRSQLYDSGG